ncbi:retrotransposon protein, putative, ty1-copia subclass [Tanacetum coccineum]
MPKEVNSMKNVPYASAVGSIMYAVRCTRPDVAFAQNMTSRFQQNPGEPHWTAVKNILKYLRNTKDMLLVYGGNPSTELRVECYCDVGFETDRDDTKSQTGYVFVLNGGVVDWKSSKQSTTAMSATESEYIAASEAAMEVVWIRKFILGLGIVPTINDPLNMYCNNSAAVHYAKEPGFRWAPDTTIEMVLRVERKLFVIEQPISLASPTDSEYLRSGMRYMIHNEELKSMFEKQVGVEWFDLIQTFHACKQDEGKPVGPYHNMGKTVGELHAMLNEYKKGLPKKAETPQVMMIKGGKIQKANKKSLKAKGKNKVNGKGKDKKVYIPKPKNPKSTVMERPGKDDTCHHCKEVGHCKRNCPAYLAELIKKKKQVSTASSSYVFIIELFSFPTKSWVYDTSCDNSHYAPTITRGVVSVSCLVDSEFV